MNNILSNITPGDDFTTGGSGFVLDEDNSMLNYNTNTHVDAAVTTGGGHDMRREPADADFLTFNLSLTNNLASAGTGQIKRESNVNNNVCLPSFSSFNEAKVNEIAQSCSLSYAEAQITPLSLTSFGPRRKEYQFHNDTLLRVNLVNKKGEIVQTQHLDEEHHLPD